MQYIDHYWSQFILQILFDEKPFFISSTGRKYSNNVSLTIPGQVWTEGFEHLSLDTLGYKGTPSKGEGKLGKLTRTYFNEENVIAARTKLEGRIERGLDFNSVMVSMMEGKKDSRSQGPCLSSVVITYVPKLGGKVEATVFYRITEVIKKFGADLLFLREVVFPNLIPQSLGELDSIHFVFAYAYFSAIFLPVILSHVDVVDLLTRIEETYDLKQSPNRALYLSCCRAAILPIVEKNPERYKYRTRKTMHKVMLQHLEDGFIPQDELIEYFQKRPMIRPLLREQEE